MEDKQSHPIPQDVTGFQFKLIGDMTVKQFAYLAGPAFLAWIFFQLPLLLFIKLPISLLLVGFGAALAFLPIAGRPMDVMIVNFIKALFSSTLYIYQKKGMRSWAPTIRLSYQKPVVRKEKAKAAQINEAPTMPQMPPQVSPMTQPSPMHPQAISMYPPATYTPGVLENTTSRQTLGKIQGDKNQTLKRGVADLNKELKAIRKETELLEKKPHQEVKLPQAWQEPTAPTTSSTKETLDLQKQLQAVLAQKEQLTKQLMALQKNMELQKKDFFTPTIAKAPQSPAKPKIQTQNVRQIPKGLGKSVGLPITPDNPNIITGIIKDPRGNPLGNILVEIKDNDGNPVRAFKTNGLGEFASATPLTNGVYTISFEDPKGQNKFDGIEFSAKGEVILPIEVISIDTREELRKALFKED